MIIPFVIKRLFSPDGGLNKEFKFIMAGFANIPVSYVKVITIVNGLPDGLAAHIAGNGLHGILLMVSFSYDGLPTWDKNQSSWYILIPNGKYVE
jgi:hypothetical protein